MTVVIRLIAWANGEPLRHSAGKYLKSFDADFNGGKGIFTSTENLNKAMKFANQAEAFVLWQKQSKVMPLRPDGKPNRPLTSVTVEMETLP